MVRFGGIQNCPFTHLTVRKEINIFESDVSTPTSKGRSGNRNHVYVFGLIS